MPRIDYSLSSEEHGPQGHSTFVWGVIGGIADAQAAAATPGELNQVLPLPAHFEHKREILPRCH